MHYDKWVEPGENISLGTSTIKCYNLAKKDEPVPEVMYALSRSFLSENVDARQLGEFGFAILHRCGADFYFLLLSTWKNGNELWESVYAKQSDQQVDFAEFPMDSPHHATFCVWEPAVVWHEQQAWRRHLLSDQSDSAKLEYLRDKYRGIA